MLIKKIAKGLKIKTYGNINWNIVDDLGQLHHLAIKQAAYVPNIQMHYCLLNVGARKPMTFFNINVASKWNNSQTIAFSIGVNKEFEKIPLYPNSNTPCFFSASGTAKFIYLQTNLIDDVIKFVRTKFLPLSMFSWTQKGKMMMTHKNLYLLQPLMMRHCPLLISLIKKRVLG